MESPGLGEGISLLSPQGQASEHILWGADLNLGLNAHAVHSWSLKICDVVSIILSLQ